MKYIIKFLKLPFQQKALLVEAYLLLGYASFLIKNKAFKQIAWKLGEENKETVNSNTGIDVVVVRQVSRAIQTMSRHTPWESKCLVQAFAAKYMLNRRKQRSTVYLGVAKNENDEMIAHAWVRCGMFLVTGGAGHRRFTVTGRFAS